MDRLTAEALARAAPPSAAAPGTTAGAARLSDAEIRSIIFGILLAMLLAALDQTIVATALPTIGREFGDVGNLSWIVTAYLLAATAVTPLYGKFSDTHGRRVTMLIGIGVFIAGSLACALATSLPGLVVARFVQGLGGGGLISLAQTVVADVIAPRERGRYQVYFASVFATSSLAGPVLGGVFAEHLHWSVIFWINLPLGLLALAMTNRALRRLPRHERPHRLDWLGAGLLTASTITLLLALSWGGVAYPWTSPRVLGLVAASAGLWALFATRLRLAREPLIPLTLLRNPVVRAGTLAACFAMGTYIGLTIFMPVYFEAVVGLTAAGSGLAVIPLMIGTVCGATASGRALTNFVHYKRVPIAGLLVAMAATGVLVAAAGRLPLVATEVVLALLSFGLGTVLPVATVSIQNAVPPHELGTATSIGNFFRSLGGAFVVAVFGAILFGGTGAHGLSFEALHGGGAGGGAGGLGGEAVAGAFRLVFAAALAGFALALAFLLAMEERPLRGPAKRAAEAAIAD